MIHTPTTSEKIQAILDARKPVAEYLQKIGKIEAFNDFTMDDICGLIRVASDAVQDGYRKQVNAAMIDDDIPF